MTEDRINDARNACKNVIEHLDSGRFLAAEAWADHAADMISEANVEARQVARIVAPHDGATTGDNVAIVLSACVLVWMVVSMLTGTWML